jgi:hypothetical protein
LNEALKAQEFVHLFSFDALDIHDRIMDLFYNDHLGYHFVTHQNSAKLLKLKQIQILQF